MKINLNEALKHLKNHEVQASILMKETRETIELNDKFILPSLKNYNNLSDEEKGKEQELILKGLDDIENKIHIARNYIEENVIPLNILFLSLIESRGFTEDVLGFEKHISKHLGEIASYTKEIKEVDEK